MHQNTDDDLNDYDYQYADHLVAQEPKEPCRILLAQPGPREILRQELYDLFKPGDLLVINNTKVEKRRVFAATEFFEAERSASLEILFLEASPEDPTLWQVLFPARAISDEQTLFLPGAVQAKLVARGLPQTLRLSQGLAPDYFFRYGEMALPPYIQKARGERHTRKEDDEWYQTEWAKHSGSAAAPTASLHFKVKDFDELRRRGVTVLEVTLHVGAGTFFPVKTATLAEHQMHKEWAQMPKHVAEQVLAAKARGVRVWALGTTVCRTLESLGAGLLKYQEFDQTHVGFTDLFIRPGFQWQFVTGLLTNFHQPKSTLLALVRSFAGRKTQIQAYDFAIENKFRLFSYGDLSVWMSSTEA
jgi:S-adenosylmethionine:tRNA ribosyltransferase-isomerase